MSSAPEAYDVVIIGCGGLGSAVAHALTARGLRVVGFDHFARAHDRGSSHGTERIVRTAYTDEVYARLGAESIEQWRSLDALAGGGLLRLGGGIDFGIADELDEIERSCRAAGMPVEMLDASDARARFPGFRFDTPVLWQPVCGTVNADAAVRLFQDRALAAGADLHFSEPVRGLSNDGDLVTVHTAARTVQARRAVFTMGAWADRLLDSLLGRVDGGPAFADAVPALTVTDEQVFFFRPIIDAPWPTFIRRDVPEYYGLPTPDGRLKAGGHYTGRPIDPDIRPEPDADARAAVSEWMRENVPGVDPEPLSVTTCLYASYPDEDFLVDRVGNVVVGVGLGGHGFKFLPVLARRVADLVEGESWVDNPFTLHRTARSVGPSGHK
ncbi:MAG: hypothetical protein RIU67_2133 [Actinomycetota bacterium]